MKSLSSRQLVALVVASGLLLIGYLAYAGYVAGAWTGTTAETAIGIWVYEGLIVAAAVACLARAVLVSRERGGWALLAIALGFYAAAEIFWVASSGELATPSLADAGYLLFYPIAYAGLIVLARGQIGGFPAVRWLDGLIVGSATAAVAVALMLDPIVAASTEGSVIAVATNLSYPIADLTLLALVVAVAGLSGWRPGPSWVVLGAGLIVMGVSDVVYLFQSARGTYVEDQALDLAWPAGLLLIAAAAWLPVRPRERVRRHGGVRAAYIPAGAALIGLAILFADRYVEVPATASALALLTLFGVIVRLALSFREGQVSLERSVQESLTDPLTGLGNRRRFMRDLAAAAAGARGGGTRLLAAYDLDGFKAYNDAFGHPAGDQLLARLACRLRLATRAGGRAYRLGGDEFCLLVECVPAEVEQIVERGLGALTENGKGFRITASQGSVLIPNEAATAELALQIADRRMYADKSRERASAGSQSRDVLMAALRERRPELHEHLVGVAGLALLLADELGLEGEKRDEVRRAAELHDIGKVAIPDAILSKPGPLDEREMEFMRKHVVIGERIIGSAPALVPVARLVRCSHERPDGRGYPNGLTGEEIPIGARIIAVCDAYDAMVSERPYSIAMTPARALEELRAGSGTQFDATVVAAFCRIGPIHAEELGESRTPSPGAD